MRELLWISKHQKEMKKYSGKWVALTDKGLIAAGDSLSEVSEVVKKRGIKDVMFMKIPRKDEDMSIL
ncbi:MAG: DUF5678 domain-containing protein [Candidatus Aenigmatarchaeota archaeon]